MIIVENQQEQDLFFPYWNREESIIIPIWEDLEKHPMNNQISFLYIRFQDEETDTGYLPIDFIIPFNHNDCFNIELDLSQSTQSKWVWNKKGFLQSNIKISNIKDIQTNLFFEEGKLYPFGDKLEVLTNFYTRLGMRDGLGKSIPIMKWGEVLRCITNDWKLEFKDSWIDDTMLSILSQTEQLGIRVDRKKFIDRWPNSLKNLQGDIIFTEYNPYTITSRPSNRHGGINFSALNKGDGTREVFIPQDGKLFLQFDYDAYHVRIIGKLIGYELPTTSVHQWLADKYELEYDESKGRTFRILYGGVSEEDKKIPFFQKVDDFIQLFWKNTQMSGFIQTPKRRIPLRFVERPNAQKVFNYLLQSMETEFNIEVLKKLKEGELPLPILYTYDSFLFQFDDTEVDIIKKVKSVLESFGFPVNVDWGKNYAEI